MVANLELSNGHRTGKGQFSFQSQRRAMPKNVDYLTIAHISHASKVMLKILQARLQQYVNRELSDVQEAVPWLRVYSSRLFPFGIIKPRTPFVFHLNLVLEFAVIMYVSPHFSFCRRFDA